MEIFMFIGMMTVFVIVMVLGYHSGYFLGIPLSIFGSIYSYIKWSLIISTSKPPDWHCLVFVYFCVFLIGLFIRFSMDWQYSIKRPFVA